MPIQAATTAKTAEKVASYVEQLRPLLHATLGSGEFVASSHDLSMTLAARTVAGDSGPSLDSQLLDPEDVSEGGSDEEDVSTLPSLDASGLNNARAPGPMARKV